MGGCPKWAVWSLLLAGCTFGADDNSDSPFDTAAIEAPAQATVADGRTEAVVVVTGEVGRTFDLGVQGAVFARPSDPATPTATAVFLADDGSGVGRAETQVVATSEGFASVFFLANRVASARTVEFVQVSLVTGAPVSAELSPGVVEHRVCVGSNSGEGTLSAAGQGGTLTPASPELSGDAPAGLDCPSGGVGYTEIGWASATGQETVTLGYLGPDAMPLVSVAVDLTGDAFPGYDLTASPPTMNGLVATVDVSAQYSTLGSIGGGPAHGVALGGLRFVPEMGPTLIGSSSGDATAPVVTAADGSASLFFSVEGLAPATYTLFATPLGGATAQLVQITVGP